MENSIWKYLQSTDKAIVIYGMGNGAEKLLDVCNEKNITVSGIFSSDEFCRYQSFRGFTVKKLNDILSEFSDPIILLAFAAFKDDLVEKIIALSKEYELYAPHLPMFDSPLFDEDYYIKNKDFIEETKYYLADEKSKEVFDDIINYRLSGKIDYLLKCESKSNTFEGLIFNDKPIYLDLGAYDGDTAKEFYEITNGNYDSMHLFEPNKKILPKLISNTEKFNCRIYNYAAWNKNESLQFDSKTGRSASLSAKGKTLVEAKRPDSIINKCDLIKFDVEGAELEAINGCKKIIENYHPQMIISAYHKTEDLFNIPREVLKISDYKIYLRHKRYIPDWDTLYYFV